MEYKINTKSDEEIVKFKCFNKNQPAQIPLSSIDLDSWYLRDTSIVNLIKHGVREFFIHTDNLIPLMFFIHKAKNPGIKIMKEISVQLDILDMEKHGVLDVYGISKNIDKIKPNYIASTDKNLEIMKKMIYDQYADKLDNFSEVIRDGILLNNNNTYDNFTIIIGEYNYKYTFNFNNDILDLDSDISDHILYQMEKNILYERNINQELIEHILSKYYMDLHEFNK